MFLGKLVSDDELDSLASRVDLRELSGAQILVTGASGMVGAYLTTSILGCSERQGRKIPNITVLARDSRSQNLVDLQTHKSVRVIGSELHDWKLDQQYDCLLHLASPASPTKYHDTSSVIQSNVGFLKRISGSNAPRTILFVSSGEVYGANPPIGVDEDFQKAFIPESKRDVYPKAKLAAEHLLGEMWRLGYTTPFIARLFHTFGPGLREDDGRSFGDFLWSAARGKQIMLKSSGQALRTFLYLEDATAGLLTILTRGSDGDIYNVGSENPVSILNFAKVASKLADVGIEIPLNEEGIETLVAPSPSSRIVPSCQKLRNLGWAQEVSMEESISRTISWIKRSL